MNLKKAKYQTEADNIAKKPELQLTRFFSK